jgi:arginase
MLFNQNLNQKISLLGICSGLGQKQTGLENSADVLRQHGLVEILSRNATEIIDLDNLKPEDNEDRSGWDLIKRIRETANQSLKNGNLLFTMGGDHSISIGTVQATLQTYPNARVIWVDAHGDMNTPQTSLTGNLHGMPLAALLGLFKTPISGPILSAEKLLIVGVRDLDTAEQMFFEDLNINFISAKEILLSPILALQKMDSWLKTDADCPIHLSFDVDALDPSVAPATGLRVPLGLSVEFAKKLVNKISMTEKIVSIDLVEFNPLLAENPTELNQTIESVKSIFQ